MLRESYPGPIDFLLFKKGSSPLESLAVGQSRQPYWIEYLATDPAFLHSMVFLTRSYFELMCTPEARMRYDSRTLPHYLKAVGLVRKRISQGDGQEALSEATISTVLSLVGHAHLAGDFVSARHHLEGVRRIIVARGGMSTLEHHVSLLTDIAR